MPNSFEILAGFLERFGDEVEGRQNPEPPPEIRIQLRALACGDLSEIERDELFLRLKQNPAWVACLAAEIQALRKDSEPRD